MKRAAFLVVALFAAGTARAEDAAICTDRPTKANAVCTVPAGTIQLETSGLGWTMTEGGGSRAELLTIASTVAKVGLSDRSDLQIGFAPITRLTTKAGGSSERISGFGDIAVRYKHRLTDGDAPVQLALIPFVKLPTARDGLGNGKVEGGLAVPISFTLASPVTVTLGPELDLLADADGSGRHLALVNLVNLSLAVAPRLTAVGELWTNLNFDPQGTLEQISADAAVAYAIANDLQLDLGANVGLTADTPDLELYAGISLRF